MNETFLPALLSLLEIFQGERHKRSETRQLAITAFYVAANETEIYMAQLGETGRRNRKREEELSRLWNQACTATLPLNKKAAELCELKSKIWLWPTKWKDEHVHVLGLGLSEVRKKVAKLV